MDTALAKQMCRYPRSVLLMVQELGTLPAPARVAARMCWLAEMAAREEDVSLALSQTDIAATTNATRQTVNHTIMEMQRLGIVEALYGKVVVRDLSALRRYRDEHQRDS